MTDTLITVIGGIISASIAGVAAVFAAKAEKNSRPVSNGFAKEVLEDLREIRKTVTEHLRDHSKGI